MSILQQLGHSVAWAPWLLCLSIMGLILLVDHDLRNLDMTGLQPQRVAFTDGRGDVVEVHSVPLHDDVDAYATGMIAKNEDYKSYYIIEE